MEAMKHPQSTTSADLSTEVADPAPTGATNLEELMLWIASASFIVGGIVATGLGLLQPATESGLRVAATCLGLLLTSVGGVIASYGITRSATAREEEAAYNAYLNGVAEASLTSTPPFMKRRRTGASTCTCMKRPTLKP